MADIFSPLFCSVCEEAFSQNQIPNACPKCGSSSFRNPSSPVALRVGMTNSYALTHLRAAALYSRNSGALEGEFASRLWGGLRFQPDNEAFVISSIFHSVAFLEATINEFFAKVANGSYSEFNDVYDDVTVKRIEQLWRIDIPRTATFTTLKKYDIALILCKRDPFESGREPQQNAHLLVTLRNYLIHAEPEIHTLFTVGDIDQTKNVKAVLSEGLKNKFPENKFMENLGNPFFPYKCLGHGCAAWAVKSSISFSDEFFSRLGLKSFYADLGEELATEWLNENDDNSHF